LFQAAVNRLHVGDVLAVGGIPVDCLVDRGLQSRFAARFRQEIERSALHRQHGRFHVGVRGEADHRPMVLLSSQRAQAFQIDIGMGHVEQDAACIVGR